MTQFQNHILNSAIYILTSSGKFRVWVYQELSKLMWHSHYSARCTWIILFPAEGGIRSLAKLSREEMVAVKHSLNCLFDLRVGLGWVGRDCDGMSRSWWVALDSPRRKKRRVGEVDIASSRIMSVTTGLDSMSVAPRLSKAVQKLERWALHQLR